MTTASLVCLLAFNTCNTNNFMSRGGGNHRGLSRRQGNILPCIKQWDTISCNFFQAEAAAPDCVECELPPVSKLQPAINFLTELGKIAQAAKGDFNNLFGNTFTDVEEFRAAIKTNIQDIQRRTDETTTKLSIALEDTDSCPPLGNLILGFRVHFDYILERLESNLEESVTDVDHDSVFAALAQSIAKDVSPFFTLLQDLFFQCANVLIEISDCVHVARIIYITLDPNGKLSKALEGRLSLPGSAATNLTRNILGGLLPDGGAGGLDVLHIFCQLLCAFLRLLNLGTDYSQMTGGFCPTSPENTTFITVIENMACAAAAVFRDEELPEQIIEICGKYIHPYCITRNCYKDS